MRSTPIARPPGHQLGLPRTETVGDPVVVGLQSPDQCVCVRVRMCSKEMHRIKTDVHTCRYGQVLSRGWVGTRGEVWGRGGPGSLSVLLAFR